MTSDFRANIEITADVDVRDLDRLSDSIEDLDSSIEELSDSFKGASDSADDVEKSGNKASSGIGNFFRVVAAGLATFGLITVLQDSVNAFSSLNTQMALVEAQTGLTGGALEDFQEQATDIYLRGLGDSFEDVAQTMARVSRITGETGDTLEDLTVKAILFDDVFGYDVEESLSAAEVLMQQFGISSGEAFDLMTFGLQKTGDPANDLLDTFREYSGNFADMQLSADEFLSLMITGLEGGARNTDDLADSIREFNIRLLEGLGGDSEWQDAFLSLGPEAQKMFDDLQSGAASGGEALNFALDALREMDDDVARNAIGVALFGTKWEDVGSQVFEAMDISQEALEGMEGATDRSSEALERSASKTEIMKRAFQNFMNTAVLPLAFAIGEDLINAAKSLAPTFADIEKAAKPIFDFFNDIVSEIIKFVKENEAVLDIIESVAIALGLLAAAMGVATIATTSFGIAVSVLLSPITLIVAALAALAFAYKENLFGVKDFIDNGLNVLIEVFGKVADWLGELVNAFASGDISGAISMLGDAIKNGFEALTSIDWGAIGTSIITALMEGFNSAVSAVINFGNWVNDNIVTPIQNAITETDWGKVANDAWNLLKNAFANSLTTTLNAFLWLWKNIFDPIMKAIDLLSWASVASTMFTALVGALNLVVNTVWDVGTWLANNILDPILKWVTNVDNWINLATTLWNAFVIALTTATVATINVGKWLIDNIVEPMTTWASDGGNWSSLVDDIWGTLSSALDIVESFDWKPVNWLRDNVISPMDEAISELTTEVAKIANQLWKDFRNAITDAPQAMIFAASSFIQSNIITPISEAINTAQSTLTNFANTIWRAIKNAFSSVTPWRPFRFMYDNIITPISETINTLQNTLTGFATTIWNTIKNAFSSVTSWRAFIFIQNNIVTPISEAIDAKLDTLRGFATTVWDAIKNAFSSVVSWDALEWVRDKIINPITSGLNSLSGDIGDALNAIIPDEIRIEIPTLDLETEIAGVTIGEKVDFGDIVIPLPNPFAKGGFASGLDPILVGEKGPEILFPSSRGGFIMPNREMRNVMSNERQIIHNVITLDGQVLYEAMQEIEKERA